MFWQMLGILVTTAVIGTVMRFDRRLEAADAAVGAAPAPGAARSGATEAGTRPGAPR
jgi:hypothetical protein